MIISAALRVVCVQRACCHGAPGSDERLGGARVGMAREDAVRCLRCLLYALNLLFWVRGAAGTSTGILPDHMTARLCQFVDQ